MFYLRPGLTVYLLSECSGAVVSASQDIVFCSSDRSLRLMRPNLEGKNTIMAHEFRDSEFGEIERQSFLVPVEQCDRDTLLDVIKEWVLPGTTVVSDCWKAPPTYQAPPLFCSCCSALSANTLMESVLY
ncbi:hypothetical protein J6590_069516 [Homalodisca vitripennis]|nr:hypothetical protein J6590_069516 [Homalodisca vitripennis]